MGGGGPAVGEGELGAPHEAVVEHRGRVQRHGRRLGVHESAADVNAPTQEATQVTRHRLVHVEILDGRPLMAAASLGIRASARADSLRHAVAARGELLSKSKVTIRVESHYPSRKSLSESKVTFRVESHYPSRKSLSESKVTIRVTRVGVDKYAVRTLSRAAGRDARLKRN